MDITQFMNESTFGNASHAELGDLTKALQILQTQGRETADSLTQSGAPLKAESLDAMIRTLTYDKSRFTVYNDIPKETVYNNVNERINLFSHGSIEGGFVSEGEVGQENDVVFERKASLVKYIVEIRRVTYQATLVKTHPEVASMVAAQTEGGIMTVMARANKNIVTANSANVPDEWDGIYAQHMGTDTPEAYYNNTAKVIDLRGAALGKNSIATGTQRLEDVYGTADTLYAAPSVIEGYVEQYTNDQRILMPSDANGLKLGYSASSVDTQYGTVKFRSDTFMNPRDPKTSGSGSIGDAAPPAPIAGGTPAAIAAADTLSKFVTADAGDYIYAVTAYNKFGESAPTFLGTAITVAAADAVDLNFTQGTPVSGRPTSAYRIYRTKKGETINFHLIAEISAAQLAAGYDGGAAGYVRDRNRIIAGTKQAFLLQNTTNIWGLKMLAPISKMNLAQVGMTLPFAVFMFANPDLYQSKKLIRYINIG